jgi:hypothetical protein
VGEARDLIARLDRGVRLARETPSSAFAPLARGARPDLEEQVTRLTLESLVVLDVLRSVPEDALVPAELADALGPLMPRLDRAMHTHHALLSRMPRERRRALDRRVRAQPDAVMDVAAWIDDHAGRLGVPADNRARLRHSAMTVGTRLRRQSTNAVVADCVAKLDEAIARQAIPLPRELADRTSLVVDAMWQRADDAASQTASPIRAVPPSDAIPPSAATPSVVVPERFGTLLESPDPQTTVQWNDSWARPGDEEIRLGAIMMPLGLVTCGVLLIVGTIVLAVGEGQNGGWDGRTHADDATTE